MVRLRERCYHLFQILRLFQFHYGTIERGIHSRCSGNATLFQFHYGTIERDHRVTEIKDKETFQFHYGTIERRKHRAKRSFQTFQFHYGTIESIFKVYTSR